MERASRYHRHCLLVEQGYPFWRGLRVEITLVEAQLAVAVAAYGKDVVVVAEEKSVVPATGDHDSLFSFDGHFFVEGCLHLDLQAGYGRRGYYFVSRLQAALPVIILAPCPGVALAVYHGSVVLSRR